MERKIIKIIINIFFVTIILCFSLKAKNNNETKPIINTKIKVAMCTLCKKENKYIKYFIEYYKILGYNHFYLYDQPIHIMIAMKNIIHYMIGFLFLM